MHQHGVSVALHDPHTIMLASVPLDAHGWEPLDEGTALAIRDGSEVMRARTV